MGRFAKKQPQKAVTSSTRPSTRLDPDSAAQESGEDALIDFLQRDLKLFFANVADASLLVKVLVADGIVSCKYQVGNICFWVVRPMGALFDYFPLSDLV